VTSPKGPYLPALRTVLVEPNWTDQSEPQPNLGFARHLPGHTGEDRALAGIDRQDLALRSHVHAPSKDAPTRYVLSSFSVTAPVAGSMR